MEPETNDRISNHLAGCRDCSEEARGIERVFRSIESKSWTPSENYWASILPRVHRQIEESSRSVLPRWTTGFAMPLAAAIALAVGIFKMAPQRGEDFPENFSAILAQLAPEELQEVADQQTVAAILHPDFTPAEQTLSSADELENVKAILREDGRGTTDIDAQVATGIDDAGAQNAGPAAPALQQVDTLN